MRGRGPSLLDRLRWSLASYGERRLNFCRECRVRFPQPSMEVCSNCGAQRDPHASPSGKLREDETGTSRMRTVRRAATVVLSAFLLAACSATDQGMPGSSPSSASAADRTSPTPIPTPTPAPTPLALSGSGSKVTDPFHLASGNYRVSWTAQGHSNFIVHIHAGDQDQGLVNEIPPEPSSGEAFFRAGGGQYFLEIDASTLTWTITFTPIAG